jgi:predicted nucleotidyltransferase component of viral defense system
MVTLNMAMVSKNILPLLVKQLARILRCGVLPEGSYLAGGTAVYFYLRHRVSVDLDFFTRNEFSAEIFLYRMKECFDEVAVEIMGKDTIILYLGPEKLKFSLFYLPYGLLSRVHKMSINEGITCPLASLNDITAMKAVAINQRGSIKDFVDLFFILDKTGMDFNDVAGLVTRKYNLDQDYDYQLKTSFVYFDDAEKEMEQIIMLEDNQEQKKLSRKEWEDIKSFYLDYVK